MDREKRFLTWKKPDEGNFNYASFPNLAKAFRDAFLGMKFDWIPSDVDVEYDRTWLPEFRQMERELRDNPDMLAKIGDTVVEETDKTKRIIINNSLPIILDTAIQFYIRGWIQARKDKYLYRKEYFNESNNNYRQTD